MKFQFGLVLWLCVLLLLVGVYTFLTYHACCRHSVYMLWSPSLVPRPAVRLRLPDRSVTQQPFVVLSNSFDSLTQQYCDKYGLVYMPNTVLESEPWSCVFHVLRDSQYEYVILLLNAQPWSPDSDKPVQQLIQHSQDSDLIASRDPRNPSLVDMHMLIFKNSEWSQFKCMQLHFNPTRLQSVLLHPVYNTFKPQTLLEAKKQVDLGLPYMLQSICVYHEKAFDLRKPERVVYPWTGVPGFVEVPKRVFPRFFPTESQQIPRIIFQTMNTTLVNNDRYKYSVKAWQELNPEYEYRYYDALDARMFIEQHFDADVSLAYDMLLPGTFKADLLRYCLLYVFGGCYVDSQTQPFLPLRSVIDKDSELVSARDYPVYGLLAGFLCCTPQHPVPKLCIHKIVHSVLKRKHYSSSLGLTGPERLGKCLNKWLGRRSTDNVKHGLPPSIKLLDSDYSDNFARYKNNEQYFIYVGDVKFVLIKYIYNKEQLEKKEISIDSLTGKEHYREAHSGRRIFKKPLLLQR
jgi:mannosyltransferase OCH1-like enzyme